MWFLFFWLIPTAFIIGSVVYEYILLRQNRLENIEKTFIGLFYVRDDEDDEDYYFDDDWFKCFMLMMMFPGINILVIFSVIHDKYFRKD
jgi:hypothetical protein